MAKNFCSAITYTIVIPNEPLNDSLVTQSIHWAQKSAASRAFRSRKSLGIFSARVYLHTYRSPKSSSSSSNPSTPPLRHFSSYIAARGTHRESSVSAVAQSRTLSVSLFLFVFTYSLFARASSLSRNLVGGGGADEYKHIPPLCGSSSRLLLAYMSSSLSLSAFRVLSFPSSFRLSSLLLLCLSWSLCVDEREGTTRSIYTRLFVVRRFLLL